jgi:hypothetical protein
MLPEKEFEKKYETTYGQRREESFLETVSEEDRSIYADVEILTGLNIGSGKLNRYFQIGQNKGLTYDTTKIRFMNGFKKFVDAKIVAGEADEIFERMWKSSKGGSFNHLKYLFDRVAGQMKDEIEITTEGDISFTIDNTKIIRKKEKE